MPITKPMEAEGGAFWTCCIDSIQAYGQLPTTKDPREGDHINCTQCHAEIKFIAGKWRCMASGYKPK